MTPQNWKVDYLVWFNWPEYILRYPLKSSGSKYSKDNNLDFLNKLTGSGFVPNNVWKAYFIQWKCPLQFTRKLMSKLKSTHLLLMANAAYKSTCYETHLSETASVQQRREMHPTGSASRSTIALPRARRPSHAHRSNLFFDRDVISARVMCLNGSRRGGGRAAL